MAQHILIAEDDNLLRQTLTDMLTESGYVVTQAVNGREALKLSLEKHPDLIITDNLMPEMTGLEWVTQLRQDEWGKLVPAIIMTNLYDVEAVNASLQTGITDYVMKADVGADKIIEIIKSHLKSE